MNVGKDWCVMGLISSVKKLFVSEAPKVACPKCSTIHDINAECKCPGCGLKYKLPREYDVYVENAREAAAGTVSFEESDGTVSGTEYSDRAVREASQKREKNRFGTLIKLSVFAVAFSLLFLALMLFFFRDKDALIYKTGNYENQPVFYHTQDGVLHCAFPNDKGCSIGKGELVDYLSCADGKCVYLTYTGEFASAETSNYVLRISKFGKKVQKIAESKEYVPHIVSGGNNKYLYILTPKDESGNVFDMTLSIDGEKPLLVAKSVRELAVSTSGRFAFFSLEENGTTKMIVYSAAKNELTNPGIKNAHPLSIDNKGEYMVYARKNTADSTDIIVEKSTTERIEIPIFKETSLKSVIFSEDRRTFAVQYTDRTVFYTCTDKDYSISNTYEGSLFGYDFNDYVCHNYITFKEIPEILNVFGKDLLPYYYYDRENRFVYKVSEGGTRESVFDTHSIDELRVSDNGRCAFVSNDILYTGKLDKKNNEITRIMTFSGCTLVDISPDGKFVYYTDADGNMFRTQYGEDGADRVKLTVDPGIVKISDNGDMILTVSGGTASIIDKKGKTEKLCDGFDVNMSAIAADDLSGIFYVNSEADEESREIRKSLYLYRDGKSKLISDKVSDVCTVKDSARIDMTKSSYVDVLSNVQSDPENTAVDQNNSTIPVPVHLPEPEVK